MKYNKCISRALRTGFFGAENSKYFKEKIFYVKIAERSPSGFTVSGICKMSVLSGAKGLKNILKG